MEFNFFTLFCTVLQYRKDYDSKNILERFSFFKTLNNITITATDNSKNDISTSLSRQHCKGAKDNCGEYRKMELSSVDVQLINNCDQDGGNFDVEKMETCAKKNETKGAGEDSDGHYEEDKSYSSHHEIEESLGGESVDEAVQSSSTDVPCTVAGMVGDNIVNYTCPPSPITHTVPATPSLKLEVPELATNSVDGMCSAVFDDNSDLKKGFGRDGYSHFSVTPPSPSGSYVKTETTEKIQAHVSKTETVSSDESGLSIMDAELAFHNEDEKIMGSLDVPIVESIDSTEQALSSDGDDKTQADASSPLASSIEALNKIDSNFASVSPPSVEQTSPHIPTNSVLPKPRQSVQEFSASPSRVTYASPPGRRSIKLRLLEEVEGSHSAGTPFSKRLNLSRRFRSLSLSTVMVPLDEKNSTDATSTNNTTDSVVDRGTITVSWYEGTTSSEMQEHVTNCVLRKLNSSLQGESKGIKIKLEDVRLLDDSVDPREGKHVGTYLPPAFCMIFLSPILHHFMFVCLFFSEVVLCPFLPDGSQFLLRFRTRTEKAPPKPIPVRHEPFLPPYASRAPDSPSAEPVRFPTEYSVASMNIMNAQQLQMLNAAAVLLQQNGVRRPLGPIDWNPPATSHQSNGIPPPVPPVPSMGSLPSDIHEKTVGLGEVDNTKEVSANDTQNENATSSKNTTDQLIEQLRKLNETFKKSNENSGNDEAENNNNDDVKAYAREEKRQAFFVISNYLFLFMSLIALSAEIQSRLPLWMTWVQENYDSVQNCATDRDALFDCVSSGDFSGLVASFLLWATQSAAAKRIFLFGFDSPKRLWTVVYEALVTAVCWGTSYIFIRRGLNPNTRQNFLQKYWKDAVYGSLAGFNAAFMKAVLKNLVPQEVALEALETRQLKIFNWLGALMANE